MLSPRLLKSKKSHIYFLKAKLKINTEKTFEESEESLFGYLEELNEIPKVSVILKVVQHSDLDLVLNLEQDNASDVIPFASKNDYGLALTTQETVVVGACRREKKQILGTIAHELTHIAMNMVFKNKGNPYLDNDQEKEDKFKRVEKRVKKVNLGDRASEVIQLVFKGPYTKEEKHKELIVRVPHILAELGGNGEEWLETNVPDLLKFYEEEVIPKCEKFINESFLLKPKSFITSMNKYPGEIKNIEDYTLFFKDNQKISTFSNDSLKKIFLLTTKYTWSGLLRVLQSFYGVNYVKHYDQFLVFKLDNCIKTDEIILDVDYLFSLEVTKALFLECPDSQIIPDALETIKKFLKIAIENENKKIIFIMKEEGSKHFENLLNDASLKDVCLQEIDKDFTLLDLDDNTRKKILKENIFFQDIKLSLGDLLNGDEDLLKCINQEIVHNIFSKKEIKIGSKLFRIRDLDGSYADIAHEVNLDTLVHEMTKNNNFFLIYGINGPNEKEKLIKYLRREIDVSIVDKMDDFKNEISSSKKVFLIQEDMADENFRIFCCKHWKEKIYLLKMVEETSKLMLITFYNPEFYLERRFKRYEKIIINKEILEIQNKNKIADVFIIGKHLDDELRNHSSSSKIILWDVEKEFQRLSKIYEVVHLLIPENGQLIWDKSSGSLSNLRRWIKEDRKKESKKNEAQLIAKIKNERVMILADDAGTGKSTTITKLYQIESNDLSDSHWVIRIYLKDHINSIRELKEVREITEVISFLTKIDPNLNNNVGKMLLEFALNTEKDYCKPLLLVFDGFDELLDDKDRNSIILLLKYLKNKTKSKIWVTTRLHLKEILEDELSTFAIRFNPVDEKAKRKFMKEYFKHRSKLLLDKEKFKQEFEGNNEGLELKKYMTEFNNKARHMFADDENSRYCNEGFVSTPLRLNLLLEDSIGSFCDWMEDPNKNPNFPYLGNNSLKVYKGFFERKYKIFYRKKGILEKSVKLFMSDSFEKIHEELAQWLIIKKKNYQKKLPESIIKHSSLVLLVGLLNRRSNIYEFTHFNFREYSFAQWLIKNLLNRNYQMYVDSDSFLIKNVLVKNKYHIARHFIDIYLKNQESWEFLENLTKLSQISFWQQNKGPICGFCVAVKEKNDFLLKFLFHIKFSDLGWYEFLEHKEICSQSIFHESVLKTNNLATDLIIEQILLFNFDKQCEFFKVFKIPIIHYAIERGNDSALDKIFKLTSGFNSDKQYEVLTIVDEFEQTILHVAVKFKNDSALRKIIELVSAYDFSLQFKFLAAGFSECNNNPEEEELSTQNSKTKRRDLEGTVLNLSVELENHYALEKIFEMISKDGFKKFQYELLSIDCEKTNSPIFHLVIEKHNMRAMNEFFKIILQFSIDEQYKFLCNVNIMKETVLHVAIRENASDAIEEIIKMVSKFSLCQQYEFFNIFPETNLSVFHFAVEQKNDKALNKIIKVMLNWEDADQLYNILSKTADSNQVTALHLAVKEGSAIALSGIINLIEKCSLSQQYELMSKVCKTILHLAAARGPFKIFNLVFQKVEEILDGNDLLEAVMFRSDNYDVLNYAVQSTNYDLVRFILEKFYREIEKHELLLESFKDSFIVAIKTEKFDIVNLMLDYVREPSLMGEISVMKDNQERNIFHHAVGCSFVEPIKLILKKAEEIFTQKNQFLNFLCATDKFEQTILHIIAATNFYFEIFEPIFKDISEYRNTFRSETIVEMIIYDIEYSCEGPPIFEDTQLKVFNEITEKLSGLSEYQLFELISKKNFIQQTILHYICMMGNMEIITWIFDNLDWDKQFELLLVKDECGQTALHWAAALDRENVFVFLFDKMMENVLKEEVCDFLLIENKQGKSIFNLVDEHHAIFQI